MKIVISDFPKVLLRNIEHEVELLKKALPGANVVVHPFVDQINFLKEMEDADGLITAFLTIDDDVLSHCKRLKCISVNATGYNSIDLEAAGKRHITVCALKGYCTEEVADFTMALLLTLSKKIKMHQHYIENEHMWEYKQAGSVLRLRGKEMAIIGFGRIGQAVAKRAQAFGIKVVAVDPFLPGDVAEKLNVKLVDRDYVLQNADIISNHMSVPSSSTAYFDWDFFKNLKKKPIFINVGRGISVDEEALLKALDNNLIVSAGLDVLSDDGLSISTNPLVGRKNVVITPHAAFYSDESLLYLQEVTCQNLISCMQGNLDDINYIVQ